MGKTSGWLIKPQPKLGTVGLLVLLTVTGLLTPLSIDMYTPAVPHMTEYFDTTEAIVNLTLVSYYLFFAIGMLVFGPVSDKYGRKPVLLWGIVVYTIGSAFCAISPFIWFLIGFRVVQALGAGAIGAVSTAIVKDAFSDEIREVVLSVLQVMFVVGPVLAPVIGALIVQVGIWRDTFWLLTVVGIMCVVMSMLFEETLPEEERYEGSVMGSIVNLKSAFVNRGFILFLLVPSAFSIPYMAYVSSASYVYITTYGLSELSYSLYYAVVAGATAVGPFVWLLAKRFISAKNFTTLLIAISIVSGVLVLTIGQLNATLFCISFLIFALAESCVRPYTTNILLSQDIDAGVASSMINFMDTIVGCVGMAAVMLPWPNYIVGLGAITVLTMVAIGIEWTALLKSGIPLKGIKD